MDKIGSAQFLQDVVTRVLEKIAVGFSGSLSESKPLTSRIQKKAPAAAPPPKKQFDPFGKEVAQGVKPEDVPGIPGPRQ